MCMIDDIIWGDAMMRQVATHFGHQSWRSSLTAQAMCCPLPFEYVYAMRIPVFFLSFAWCACFPPPPPCIVLFILHITNRKGQPDWNVRWMGYEEWCDECVVVCYTHDTTSSPSWTWRLPHFLQLSLIISHSIFSSQSKMRCGFWYFS